MGTTRKTKVVQKLKAQRLYVNRLLSAREAAAKVGVTEKTMGCWIKAGGWKADREAVAEKALDKNELPVNSEVLLFDLLEFVKENAPHLAVRLQPLINEYLSLK